MKTADLRKILVSLGDMAKAAGGEALARDIHALADMLAAQGALAFSRALAQIKPEGEKSFWSSSGKDTRAVLDYLTQFMPALAVGGKAGAVKDMSLFVDFLEKHSDVSIENIVKAGIEAGRAKAATRRKSAPSSPDMELVEKYVARLKSSYKDPEAFGEVYGEMKSDRKVRKQEAVAIADRFAFATPASTPKKEAFNRIWIVHEDYQSMVLKNKAFGGKTAA
jgi:hypothetical protein